MKALAAIICAGLIGLLAGCAGTGGPTAGSGSNGATGSSGVTVFGTIDTSVSGYRNQSR